MVRGFRVDLFIYFFVRNLSRPAAVLRYTVPGFRVGAEICRHCLTGRSLRNVWSISMGVVLYRLRREV